MAYCLRVVGGPVPVALGSIPLLGMGSISTRWFRCTKALGRRKSLLHPRASLGERDVKLLLFRFIIRNALVIILQVLLSLLCRVWPSGSFTSPLLLPQMTVIGLLKGQSVLTELLIVRRSVPRLPLTLTGPGRRFGVTRSIERAPPLRLTCTSSHCNYNPLGLRCSY